MSRPTVSAVRLPEYGLWQRMREKRRPRSFDLELTARCNFDCRHCYINLPAGDREAQDRELTLDEVGAIADQAAALGVVWCLLTGGEPLLRRDFFDLYLTLKRKGFLLAVFTNASLVTPEHVRLFHEYPPRDVEVTVYGASAETYDRVTRRPGSYAAFRRGLDLLLAGGIKVRLKAMALRSNVHELEEIGRFCRAYTKDYYRFDPLLHLRYDGDPRRNEEIRAERLSAAEIVALEQADAERAQALEKGGDHLVSPLSVEREDDLLFGCGAAGGSFSVSYDGHFHLCPALRHPDCVYDLRRGSLAEAWSRFVPQVRAMRSRSDEFLEKCHRCPVVNLCLWCPAHAYLETGRLDGWSEYFCQVGHARAEALGRGHGGNANG